VLLTLLGLLLLLLWVAVAADAEPHVPHNQIVCYWLPAAAGSAAVACCCGVA
jgi:hypothetical protein